MCWNASVSLNTYFLGLFASFLSYYNGESSFLGIVFYQSVLIMQLIEYFIWSKTFSNKLLSQLALFIIVIQPICNIINITTKPEYIPYVLISYILFILIVFTFIIPLQDIDFSSVPSMNGHLSWKWLQWNIYVLLIWYIFLISRWIIDKLYLPFIIVSIFLIVSIILFKDTYTWGSMWCWICNLFSLYFLFSVFYKDFCTI